MIYNIILEYVVVESETEVKNEKREPREPPKKTSQPDKNAYETLNNKRETEIELLKKKIASNLQPLIKLKTEERQKTRALFQEKLTLLKSLRDDQKKIVQDREAVNSQMLRVEQDLENRKKKLAVMRKSLRHSSIESIDDEIRHLEDKMEHSSLTLKEEKEILVTIKQLKANKVEIVQFENAKSTNDAATDLASLDALRASRKEKTQIFATTKEEINKLNEEVSALRANDDKANAEVGKLIELKKEANDKITELLNEQRAARKAYKEAERAFLDYQGYQDFLRRQKYREEKEARLEEEKARAAEFELEDAQRDHWAAEKELANQLINYLKRFLPSETVASATEDDFDPSSRREIEDDSGRSATEFVRETKDESILGGSGLSKSKKKNKQERQVKQEKKRPAMMHTPDVFTQFDLLDLSVPMSYDSVSASITALEEKLAWFNTNPDKSIKEEQAKARDARNKKSTKSSKSSTSTEEKTDAPAANQESTSETVAEVVF